MLDPHQEPPIDSLPDVLADQDVPVHHAATTRIMAGPRAEKTVALALQGGGAHGAFTWGVLDALIEDGRLGFEAITGASAGAMNAVVMVDGWLEDDPRAPAGPWSASGARSASTATSGRRSARPSTACSSSGRTTRRGVLEPCAEAEPLHGQPLNYNPLRKVLARQVNFERLRAAETAAVFVSATNVWTGKLAVFEREASNVDHLMASACLPTVFQAVQIDGVPYWDGGYLGNPPLYPLYRGAETPRHRPRPDQPRGAPRDPRTPQEIQDRLTRSPSTPT